MGQEKDNFADRRKFIRHPLCFPIKFRVLEKDFMENLEEDTASTKNIGEGGLMFSAKNKASLGTLILARIPFMDKIFSVKATVVYCNKNKDTNLYDIGITFQSYRDAFKVKLIEQMYLISEYRDLRSMQTGKELTMEEASQEWIERYSERFKRLYW